MKIPIWRCDKCGSPHCIMLMVDNEADAPKRCPFSANYKIWKADEIEYQELVEHLRKYSKPKICENFTVTQMCNGRGGICPKECDGNTDVCMKNVGVQRSIRVN